LTIVQDIEAAKLSVLGSMDAPVAPSARGLRRFLHGITDDMRQQCEPFHSFAS
jgi:hypothetical protein